MELNTMSGKALKISLTDKQKQTLTKISTSRTTNSHYKERSKIILLSGESKKNIEISTELQLCVPTVRKWRKRWHDKEEKLLLLDKKEGGINYTRGLLAVLSDEERPGAPAKFTAEQVCQIINVACERPEDSGLPLSHWSLSSLAEELERREIVESISTSQLCVFLKSSRDKTTQNKGLDTHSD